MVELILLRRIEHFTK